MIGLGNHPNNLNCCIDGTIMRDVIDCLWDRHSAGNGNGHGDEDGGDRGGYSIIC